MENIVGRFGEKRKKKWKKKGCEDMSERGERKKNPDGEYYQREVE